MYHLKFSRFQVPNPCKQYARFSIREPRLRESLPKTALKGTHPFLGTRNQLVAKNHITFCHHRKNICFFLTTSIEALQLDSLDGCLLGGLGLLKKVIEFAATLPRNLPDARRCLSLPKNSAAASPTHFSVKDVPRRREDKGKMGRPMTSTESTSIKSIKIRKLWWWLTLTSSLYHLSSTFHDFCACKSGFSEKGRVATRNKFTFEMVSVSFKKHWAVATGSLTRGQVDAPFRKDGLWLETVCQSWCNGGNLKRFGSHTFFGKKS